MSRVSYPASGASMLRAQVCALERLHTLTLVARPKTAPRRQGLPLRAYVPRSCVCTSVPTHLESRSISERTGVCTSAPTRLDSRSASEDHATTATTACPCERISHGRVCARQRLHTFTRKACPARLPCNTPKARRGAEQVMHARNADALLTFLQ